MKKITSKKIAKKVIAIDKNQLSKIKGGNAVNPFEWPLAKATENAVNPFEWPLA